MEWLIIRGNIATVGSAIYVASSTIISAIGASIEGNVAGSGAASLNCVSKCRAGTYGTCATVTGAVNCFVDCECTTCQAGTFRSTGYSIANDCTPCAAGTVPGGANHLNCTSCQVGKYATSSSSSSALVLTGASICNDW